MIKNVLLVDETVPEYEIFLQSVNEHTKAVRYSSSSTYEEIRQAFPGPVDQVGIVFVKGAMFLGKPFTEQHEFFQSLVTQFEVKHLDFLGCDTLDEWKTFYEKFTNVIIGASNNRTGNIQYGGDWTMESTMEDVEGIYFTKSIEYYKYLLDYASNTIFFIKDDGYLYGTGDNRNYQVGVDSNITVASLTPVLYNSSNFTGVTKIRGRDANTGNAFTLVQEGNNLYGLGFDFCGILAPGNTFRTEFTLATLPSTGPIQDFDTGWNTVFIVQNNKLYGRGADVDSVEPRNVPSNYRQILLNPADDNLVTNVHCDGSCMVVLANNKVYFRNVAINSVFIPISSPTGVTGVVQKIICYGTDVYAIIDNKVYQATNLFQANCEFVEKVFSGGLPNTLVTDIALAEGKLWYVNDNQLYGISQYNERGEIGNAGSGLIPYPVGVTGTIVGISSKERFALIVNINNGTTNKLYGLGINEYSQTGGTNTSDKRFLTEIPVDSSFVNVTFFRACREYTLAVVGGVLHGFGRNFQNQTGLPLRTGVYPPIPITIDGSYVSISSNAQVSTTNNLTWLGVGEDVYAAGKISGGRALLGVGITESRKFIKLVRPTNSSGNVTHVALGGTVSVFVKGNKLYGMGTSYTANSIPEEITVPAGKIQAIQCSGDTLIVLIDGTPYGIGRNYEAQLGFYGPIVPSDGGYTLNGDQTVHPITSFKPLVYNDGTTTTVMTDVTSISISQFRTTILMNNEAYISGYLNQGNQINKFTKVSLPGPVDFIANSHWYSLAVVNGTLYGYGGTNDRGGMGETVPGSSYNLTGFPVKVGGNDITGVTNIGCLSLTSVITQGKSLSWLGMNDSGVFGPFSESTLNLVTNAIMGLRMTITSSSTFNDQNYGPNGITYKIVGDLLSKIDYVQFGATRVYKSPVSGPSITITSTTATFAVPAGSGTVTPVLTDVDGNNYTLSAFNYSNPIVLQLLSVSEGNVNQLIRIRGVDLSSMNRVQFKAAGAAVVTTSIVQISSTEYTVVVPAQATPGLTVDVSVLDPYGTESNTLSFKYIVIAFTTLKNTSGADITTAYPGDQIEVNGTNLSRLNPDLIKVGQTLIDNTTLTRFTSQSIRFTVPNVLGEVAIRGYDNNANMVEHPIRLTCLLRPTALATSPSVIRYSTQNTIDTYYVMDNKIYTMDASRVFQTFYTHTNNIFGLTSSSDSLYFGDQTTRAIYKLIISTKVRSTVYTNPIMSPFALKYKSDSAKLFVACASNNVSTDGAVFVLDASAGTALITKTYATFAGYDLRGIAVNTDALDTSIYVTAVPYSATPVVSTQGRVIRLDATGAVQNVEFITALKDPRDLTFSGGYLIVDGNINFYLPDGTTVASLTTDATTITSDGTNAYFSTTSGSQSVLNQIAVPEFQSNTYYLGDPSPTQGPKGTLVFLSGNLILNNGVSGISTITVGGVNHTDFFLSEVLLTIKMPEPTTDSVVVRITSTDGTLTIFTFTYVNPDIVNMIPLYMDNQRYFHFTGHNLGNILYVDFGDTQKTTLDPLTRKAVYNVTAKSFDCSFIEGLPVNSTRILMLDAYNKTTYEDRATFTLSSETCFVAGTPVLTDQGLVAIEKIDPKIHTLDKKRILAITKIRYTGNSLVLIEQDSLRPKYPTRDTVISRKHKIYYKGKMKTAESLVGHKGVRLVPYQKQFLYNVLLKTHEKMNVNGLICETLYPKNPIVKYFISDINGVDPVERVPLPKQIV